MTRCRFVCLNSLALLVLGVVTVLSGLSQANAQNKRTVLDTVRAMDAPLEKDLEWVTAFLEERVAENSNDSLANCVLAITQFRSREFENALKSIGRANSGDTAKATRATNGKFQLLCAINMEDGATATKLFQDLLNACQRESTPFELRKSFCEWMGEIIGGLDSPEAQSPIELEILAKAKKSLIGIPEIKLSQAFENQYSRSHARAAEIRKMLQRYEELGDAGTQDMERTMSTELERLEQILTAAVKESRELSSENQAIAKSLRLEIAGFREQIRKIEVAFASNGPGMPTPVFPPTGPPIPPNRNSIYVDPTRISFVTQYVNNQPVTRQVLERRDYRDIEAERESVFQTQWSFYQSQLNNYNLQLTLYSQYQKSLAEWRRSEEQRRKQLTDERKELESQIAQIKIKLDEIEDIKKDNAGGNADLRKTVVQLKSELATVRLVLNAAKTGKPHLALRPYSIDPWLITEEKNRLLKLFGGKA